MTTHLNQYQRFLAHGDCDMYLQRHGREIGLYCCEHDAWIAWLSPVEKRTAESDPDQHIRPDPAPCVLGTP